MFYNMKQLLDLPTATVFTRKSQLIFMNKDAAVHRELSKASYIFTDKMNDTFFLL